MSRARNISSGSHPVVSSKTRIDMPKYIRENERYTRASISHSSLIQFESSPTHFKGIVSMRNVNNAINYSAFNFHVDRNAFKSILERS